MIIDGTKLTPAQKLASAQAKAEYEKKLNGRTIEQYELDMEKEQIARAKIAYADLWAEDD